MEVQVDIAFDQLVELAKQLPESKWEKLKKAVEATSTLEQEREAMREFLMNGPTFSPKQIKAVADARKRINAWRTN